MPSSGGRDPDKMVLLKPISMNNVSKKGEVIGLHKANKFIARLEKAGLTKYLAQKIVVSADNFLAEKMMAVFREAYRGQAHDLHKLSSPAIFDEEVIGLHLAHELIAKLEKAGLTANIVVDVIVSPSNFLAKEMMAALLSALPTNKTLNDDYDFEKIAEFVVTIPRSFSLRDFFKKYGQKFRLYNSDITDQNFKPSCPLLPKTRKTMSIYSLRISKTNEECLSFIARHGQLPNAQGLAILWQKFRDKLPEKFMVGFDKPENLLSYSGNLVVPFLNKSSGSYIFNFRYLKNNLSAGDCIIC